MILIIAEKPSLARNIVAAIGTPKKYDGYFEVGQYLVTYCFGHLFSLADVEDYTGRKPEEEGKKVRWIMDELPFFPDAFRFKPRPGDDGKPDAGVRKQIGIIARLCAREDVDTVVNAGDSDREGEIIVRLCILFALKTEKTQLRLWMPDQTPETIRAQLASMQSEREYDTLANEGFARTYIDWLYGVNLTRYATLKTGALMRVGRVIIPIVKAIYDRDLAIRNFKPELYYGVESNEETNGAPVRLTSSKEFPATDRAGAEAYAALLNAQEAIVTEKKKKKAVLQPGKLYSLTKLQNVLSKRYKMSMSDSLAAVQKLYEAGYLTYPRTNSEYLATAEKDKVKKILEGVKKLGYNVEFKDKKTIFDDSKIESHSALTPTTKLPSPGQLTGNEELAYKTVFRRFAAVFCAEDCIADNTELKIAVGDVEEFTLKGSVIRVPGWTKYDDAGRGDKILPELNKGDRVNILFRPTEKQTSPPKHYTVETLNNYLKNPFREEKAALAQGELPENEDDAEEYRAMLEGLELGTEATRTGIIDNARKSGYIDLKKDVYTILPLGEFLIETLGALGISMDKTKTSEMGRELKRIFRGTDTIEDGVLAAERDIASVFASVTPDNDTGLFGDGIGVCPLCGGEVVRGRYGYGCRDYKNCKFRIPIRLCGRNIPKTAAAALLTEGKTAELDGFISKKGKKFRAALILKDGRAEFLFDDTGRMQ